MFLVVQAEEVAWQQSTIPVLKSIPNLKLPGAFLDVSLSVFFSTTGNQKKTGLLVVIYRPPAAAYTQFVFEFSDRLSSLVVSSDKVIIVGNFNIHMDDDTESLNMAFNSLLDSIRFS